MLLFIKYVKQNFAILFLSFRGIASALLYEHFSDGYFSSIHVLTINPTEHLIVPVRALGEEVARETVNTLANRHGAIAAVNGGFWKLDGRPAGALKINHQWLSTPTKPRGAIGWSNSTSKVLIDRILTHIESNEGTIEIFPVSNPPYTKAEEWNQLEHVVGGTPVLIQNGCLVEDFKAEQIIESFITSRHPRTALGIKGNGDWVFVVVDGRYFGYFGGMALKELSQFMLNLGCMEALNLDGGGSSTLTLQSRVMNEPSGSIEEEGKYVEAVSDAILILEKK